VNSQSQLDECGSQNLLREPRHEQSGGFALLNLEVRARTLLLGLPCARCRAYYAASLFVCPICGCTEKVSAEPFVEEVKCLDLLPPRAEVGATTDICGVQLPEGKRLNPQPSKTSEGWGISQEFCEGIPPREWSPSPHFHERSGKGSCDSV
jgi:hypothetical protein